MTSSPLFSVVFQAAKVCVDSKDENHELLELHWTNDREAPK
jgi:hypothetical protein